ncbi:MAG: hypothetical protein LQ340_003964 [Diploschistes diacapsis]|nr:MAG: hypothetical protein LQ340_003964 [Diploschistes diacapsis]
MALAHGEVAHLLNPNYKEDVRRWLAEDCPSFDYGGFVVGEAVTEAKLLGKSPEGTSFAPIAQVATVRGPVRKLLLERHPPSPSSAPSSPPKPPFPSWPAPAKQRPASGSWKNTACWSAAPTRTGTTSAP